jgi:hypothetical protein
MVKLKAIVLQQHEEEGGHQECEPDLGVGDEEDEFARPQAVEQNSSTSYPPVVV